MNNETMHAEGVVSDSRKVARRRDLLPGWIRFFTWVFMFFGALSPLLLIFGFAGGKPWLSLFGFKTYEPTSLTGIFILASFAFLGIIAFSLWKEKTWAIKLAKIGAWYSIAACVYVMVLSVIASPGFNISIRGELIVIIPYLIKLGKIQKSWEEFGPVSQ